MAYAAAVTSTINIGCRVFCVDYRLPVVLAKEAMTIDLLSGGRLELGLGAGWLKDEYEAVGLTMDSPGTDQPIRRCDSRHQTVQQRR